MEGIAQPSGLADAGDGRLFVLEQAGRVRIVTDGELQPEPLLDLRDRVLADGERGLLGIALHPEFATNGRIFVAYSNPDGHTELREFRDPAVEDAAEGQVDHGSTDVATEVPVASAADGSLLLLIPQYTERHQGGDLAFGPDGYLYVAVGDDGRQGAARADPRSIYGTILPLDVDAGSARYDIPPDNPFVDGGGQPEIWTTASGIHGASASTW